MAVSVPLSASVERRSGPSASAQDPLPAYLLLDIARGLSAAVDLWRPHVRHDATRRRPVRLLVAERYEAWVIGWMQGQHVELHDHGPSAGALAVAEGQLVDVRLRHGLRTHELLRAGDAVRLRVGLVHDVVAPGPTCTTSIHVYSPPLVEMGFYDDGGQRERIAPVEEEHPVTDLRAAARSLHPATWRSPVG